MYSPLHIYLNLIIRDQIQQAQPVSIAASCSCTKQKPPEAPVHHYRVKP